MNKENILNDNVETVNNNFEYDMQMKKIREAVAKKFEEYIKTISYMAADAPIGVLCLPEVIEKALRDHGLLRVYDLFDCDFTEVKGLGVVRIGQLTTCLDKFFSML